MHIFTNTYSQTYIHIQTDPHIFKHLPIKVPTATAKQLYHFYPSIPLIQMEFSCETF